MSRHRNRQGPTRAETPKVRELLNGRYGVVIDRGRERSATIIATYDSRREALKALSKLRRAQWWSQ